MESYVLYYPNKLFVNSIFCKATFSGAFTSYDLLVLFLIPTSRFSSRTSAPVFQNLLQYEKFSFRSRTAEKYFQIDQSIKKCLGNFYVHKQIVPTVPKKEFLIALPFLGKFCMTLRTCLYKSVSKTLPQYNIKFIFQSKNRLSNVFKFKDSIPYIFVPALVTNVSVVIAILVIVAKRVNNSKKSAVKDHCLLSDHV